MSKTTPNIPTQNKFGILNDESDDVENMDFTDAQSYPGTTLKNVSANSSSNTTTKPEASKIKPPPIIVSSKIQNYIQFHNGIKETLAGNKCTIDYRKNSIIIQTNNLDDHKKLTSEFKLKNVYFHTYTPKNEKNQQDCAKSSSPPPPGRCKKLLHQPKS